MNEEPLTKPGRPKDSVKREDIVVAATDLFMEKGYALTSMDAVARRAGVSKLTIYSHFSDKNELFRAIMQYRCDKFQMPHRFDAEAQLSPQDALTRIAHTACAKIYRSDSLRLTRIIQAEILHHPEIIHMYYEIGPRRVKEAFYELLRSFNAQGKLSVDDPERAAEQFFSMLKGERLQRVLMMIVPEPTQAELDMHIDAAVTTFLAAYGPEKQASFQTIPRETETP